MDNGKRGGCSVALRGIQMEVVQDPWKIKKEAAKEPHGCLAFLLDQGKAVYVRSLNDSEQFRTVIRFVTLLINIVQYNMLISRCGASS
jgi:hypothetical protein